MFLWRYVGSANRVQESELQRTDTIVDLAVSIRLLHNNEILESIFLATMFSPMLVFSAVCKLFMYLHQNFNNAA